MDVEKLKKKRAVLRSNATKLMNKMLDTEVPVVELKAKLNMLNDLEPEINILNERILDMMLDDLDNEKECEDENYRCHIITEEVHKCRIIIEQKISICSLQTQRISNEDGHSGTVKSDGSGKINNFKLPRLTLEKFDLAPGNFLSFWSQFERIHSSEDLDKTTKFMYLRMSLLGSAKILMDTYPNTAANYDKAVDHLKNRYGRDELIVHAIYKELLALVRSRPSLSKLNDVISAKIRSLESFGFNSERTALLVPLIEECLPEETLILWERRESKSNENKLDELMKFLSKEAETYERIQNCKVESSPSKSTAAALVAVPQQKSKSEQSRPVTCVFCSESHFSQNCKKGLSIEEKQKIVSNQKLCFACLRPGHCRFQCRKYVKCSKCNQKHYDIMCVPRTPTTAVKETPTLVACADKPMVIMQTLVCYVHTGQLIRVLLDSASHRSYITKRLVQIIKPNLIGQDTFKHMLFGGQISSEIAHNLYEIELISLGGNKRFKMKVLDQEQICGTIDTVNCEMIEEINQLGIILAEDGVNRPVDILIGADTIGSFITGMKLINETLIAYETVLGWCLLGTSSMSTTTMTNFICSLVSHPESLWDLDALGIEKPNVTHDSNELAIYSFEQNIEFIENRYYVAIPWSEGHPTLPTNKGLAETRLNSVLKRLVKNNLYDLYDNVFNQWQEDGIIEKVNNNKDIGHFLSHRPVVKEGKTTKIRPVFDASAKCINGVSLNECIETGPNLISELMPLLLRFRLYEIGVIGDIKQAFLMIGLGNESDKEMLKFFWYRNGEIITFRHCRVVFGLVGAAHFPKSRNLCDYERQL
ncbi:uncharacterized protein LOC116166460 [Photinus pyralis]|uniref:uncharacterized protein LOC116166460 n=1 Tax=Photinus pyralis TaxID=7054 RepID=UPI00126769FB|nr:uncharacterized protein LOC116166460 [Photinus pyralis]